jgi:hypothetical protein
MNSFIVIPQEDLIEYNDNGDYIKDIFITYIAFNFLHFVGLNSFHIYVNYFKKNK